MESMDKDQPLLDINELFDQIIAHLEKKNIYFKVEGTNIYLEENLGKLPRVLIKVGQLDCFIERYRTEWNKRK